jgi:hypothetical protein
VDTAEDVPGCFDNAYAGRAFVCLYFLDSVHMPSSGKVVVDKFEGEVWALVSSVSSFAIDFLVDGAEGVVCPVVTSHDVLAKVWSAGGY